MEETDDSGLWPGRAEIGIRGHFICHEATRDLRGSMGWG